MNFGPAAHAKKPQVRFQRWEKGRGSLPHENDDYRASRLIARTVIGGSASVEPAVRPRSGP